MATEIFLLNAIKTQVMSMKGLIKTFAFPKCGDLKNKGTKQNKFHFAENCISKPARLKEQNPSTDFPT